MPSPNAMYPCMTVSTPGRRTFLLRPRAGREFSVASVDDEVPGAGVGAAVSRHLTSLHSLHCCQDISESQQPTFTRMNHAISPAVGARMGIVDCHHEVGGEGTR